MTTSLTTPQIPVRNGTSQAERNLPALAPDYVAVDERSIKDLLIFAQDYAKELVYFNAQNQVEGDWSHFLGEKEGDLETILAYLAEPEANPGNSRPHLTLFLTFLKLLQHARSQLNELTQRHLEFYYREALRLTSQPCIPDQVHVIATLAPAQQQHLLPAGTLLQAGQDSRGKELIYRSEKDLVINRASVANIKSLFTQKTTIDLQAARQNPALLQDIEADSRRQQSFLAMLMMALGKSGPGTPLPPYPDQRLIPVPKSKSNNTPNNTPEQSDVLTDLDTLLAFVKDKLYMPLSSFRTLMQLKAEQETNDAEWQAIIGYIEKIKKLAQPKPARPYNFEQYLKQALGLNSNNFADFFDTLPEIEDFYGLYRRKEDPEVQQFIEDKLSMALDDFTSMMQIVETVNQRWRQIYEILRAASRRMKQQAIKTDTVNETLPPLNIRTFEADKFSSLVNRTLGTIVYPDYNAKPLSNLDDCASQITQLENYFFISAEEFAFIRAINKKNETSNNKDEVKVESWEWQQVYSILEKAYANKELPDRLNMLKEIHQKSGFAALIRFALGDPKPFDQLPEGKVFFELNALKDAGYISEKLFLNPTNFAQIKADYQAAGDAYDTKSDKENKALYTLLELAQRRKRGNQNTRAEIISWDNLYAAQDATQVQVQQNLAGDSTTPRWRTFGQGYSPSQTGSKPAKIGFAIASPLLALAEGQRSITLTLAFREEETIDWESITALLQPPYPFEFLLSSEKKMLPIESVKMEKSAINLAEKSYKNALKITLTLEQTAPAIAPLLVKPLIQTPWPVLQMLLVDIAVPEMATSEQTGQKVTPAKKSNDSLKNPESKKLYGLFQSLLLENLQLVVAVQALHALTLQNDEQVLDAKKPFEPFGYSPVSGSSFYLAHPELCAKKLNSLSLNIEWLGAPKNIVTHYNGYSNHTEINQAPASPINTTTNTISAQLSLFNNRSTFPVTVQGKKNAQLEMFSLFDIADSTKTVHIKVNSITEIDYLPDNHIKLEAEVLDWQRYWKVELGPIDFQHSIYPQVASSWAARTVNVNEKGVEVKVVSASSKKSPKPFIVNPPYTPKIKRLTADYTAVLDIDLRKIDQNSPDQLYHLEPFGYRNLATQGGNFARPFLPQYPYAGELFIGIKDLLPPQSLALLFQLAEGSADPSLAPAKIDWHFLDGNGWQSLEEGQLLADGTNGLLNSGIIEFSLAPAQTSTILPTDLYWIRATITGNCRSVADVVEIKAQAVCATLVSNNNAADHLEQLLPAGSISDFAEPIAAIQRIEQPYSSFGGKSMERTEHFYTRVSERLRHKNRVLTSWDYEHLVLQAFPGIYKVKCLPVGSSADPHLAHVIQIIVIPDIRNKLPFDPFEPKLPADVLLQIEQYLNQHCAAGAHFIVKNPAYVRLQVRLGVRLRADALSNPGYYQNQLNEELQRYLSPWAYDRSADIVFGGKINSSLIINFVEKRPYVDYVAGIKLYTSRHGETDIQVYDESLSTLLPEAILVGDRLHKHQIDLISAEVYDAEFFTGIGHMKIGLDFKIGPENGPENESEIRAETKPENTNT